MKAKALLIIGSIILILGGGFVTTMGFVLESMTLVYYGAPLIFVGIIGISGVFSKRREAGYFYIISSIAIWLPIVLVVTFIGGDGGGNIEEAALGLGLPAFVVTVLWLIGGNKNIKS